MPEEPPHGTQRDDRPTFIAVILAAGRGERAGRGDGPKQYRYIGGRTVLRRSIDAFFVHPRCGGVMVAIHRDDESPFHSSISGLDNTVRSVHGGDTRRQSTLLALEALESDAPDLVLIHDAARPFVDAGLIDRVVDAVEPGVGALPCIAVSDTLKKAGANGLVEATVARDGLHAAQTPQGFVFKEILAAHRAAARAGDKEFTDDSSIAEWAGLEVRIVEGAAENLKITWPRDVERANRNLASQAMTYPDIRTGNGYDVHSFEAGDHVVLCGVAIPHDRKLSGHSDADVCLHALTDALLATCGEGDIGTHFPPSDPQWKGAASHIFVEHAASLVRKRGGRIANADVTLICEAPRIGAHRDAMCDALARMLGMDRGRVSVKATTNEKLGFVGRREGIAAIATVSVAYPGEIPE